MRDKDVSSLPEGPTRSFDHINMLTTQAPLQFSYERHKFRHLRFPVLYYIRPQWIISFLSTYLISFNFFLSLYVSHRIWQNSLVLSLHLLISSSMEGCRLELGSRSLIYPIHNHKMEGVLTTVLSIVNSLRSLNYLSFVNEDTSVATVSNRIPITKSFDV